jgi:hypothetical protein
MGVDMKKIICIALASIALIMAGTSPGDAFRGGHFGHGGHVRVGVFVGGPVWDPWWWGPYYPYYPYAPAPVVIEQQPDTYIQQNQPAYWYFCKNPEGYYPYVKKCPKGWLKIVPTPTQEGEEE